MFLALSNTAGNYSSPAQHERLHFHKMVQAKAGMIYSLAMCVFESEKRSHYRGNSAIQRFIAARACC
jgi:hypothetical protein